MKKILWASLVMVMMILAACGSTDEKTKDTKKDATTETTATEKNKDDAVEVASSLQEPVEDTMCEMCNMKVYMKDEDMGMFSAQAIKADGSNAFYDDIGCLLNAEVANNETNEKYVRDFKTLEWAKVEDATIVKDADVKTPMNWSYLSFVDKADAEAYVAENEGAYIEELQTIKDAALERRQMMLKKKADAAAAEAEANGTETKQSESMNMNMNSEHNHQ